MNKRKNEFKEKQKSSAFTKRVDELYFAKRKITKIESFEGFKSLKYLWLNGNKICHLGSSLKSNVLLVELYLHNNNIYSVKGCLQHLKSLQVLLLHNNFLDNLTTVLHELRNMYCLQKLNLFDNPVVFEPNYAVRVISSLPSLKVFDRNEVTILFQRSKWFKNSRNKILTVQRKDSSLFRQILFDVDKKPHPAQTKRPHQRKKSSLGPDLPPSEENEENKNKEEKYHKVVKFTIRLRNSLNKLASTIVYFCFSKNIQA